jgi:hypothetical protein
MNRRHCEYLMKMHVNEKISTHCVSYFFFHFLQLVEFALITCRHVPSQLAKKLYLPHIKLNDSCLAFRCTLFALKGNTYSFFNLQCTD